MNSDAKQQAHNKQQHTRQQQKHLRALTRGKCLEALVLRRLQVPEQVAEFGAFEELSKVYEIEQPFVARTQIELLFDVYDGRKLRPTTTFSAADSLDTSASYDQSINTDSEQQQRQRRNVARTTMRSPSWCRLLRARKRSKLAATVACCLAPSDTYNELGLLAMSPSEQSIEASGARRSNQHVELNATPALAATSWSLQALHAALAPSATDNLDTSALKRDALRTLGGALLASASSGRPLDTIGQTLSSGLEGAGLGAASLALESAQLDASAAGACVSVCLLDRRQALGGGSSLCRRNGVKVTNSSWTVEAAAGARNGRVWARAVARLAELRRRLRSSSSARAGKQVASRALLLKHIDRIARKASRKFWLQVAHDKCQLEFDEQQLSLHSTNLKRDHLDEAIELTKTSLNQLIDAQLLLRNKLIAIAATTSTSNDNHHHQHHHNQQNHHQEQQSNSNNSSLVSSVLTQIRCSEYEHLLRNNFNLLKIWQNLEESKNLVCFVCEPIKLNLQDLFIFNQQRLSWPNAISLECAHVNSCTQALNEPASSCQAHHVLLASPLVCLDAVQVKRGLIQILEALNFLHAICKLIHMNLNPKNVLVCQYDNWKLSGLEFSIRFESPTISDSASVMAHEFVPANVFICGGSGGGGGNAVASDTLATTHASAAHLSNSTAPLRRQRTLHQTKCQEYVKTGHGAAANNQKSSQKTCPLLRPDVSYLAPEIVRHSKCSHKSDLFSFGLILGQTYDLCEHRRPLECNPNECDDASAYERELKKLNERRRTKLACLVPVEMRQLLVELLDEEPNLRPSANHVLQLLKRPIELCASNDDSMRHLKASLNYLDTRLSGKNHHLLATSAATQHNHQVAVTSSTHLIDSPAAACKSDAIAGQAKRRPPTNYFKRVTSSAARRDLSAARRQTGSLQLLNLLLNAVDTILDAREHLASQDPVDGEQQQQEQQRRLNGCSDYFVGLPGELQQHERQLNEQRTRSASFQSLRIRTEQTLEMLTQVFKLTRMPSHETPDYLGACMSFADMAEEPLLATPLASGTPPPAARKHPYTPDSRSLLLVIALHRRLLEQVGAMRRSLPPICRLMMAPLQSMTTSTLQNTTNQLADKSLTSPNHRALADVEERIQRLVSGHSMGALASALADPLLKLDEFLLVFELVNDLLAFLGQKCTQHFAQRGKQLLNDLTPVTGCPSLSSSEDDDYDDDDDICDDDEDNNIAQDTHLETNDNDDDYLQQHQRQQQQHFFVGSTSNLATGRGSQMSSRNSSNGSQQTVQALNGTRQAASRNAAALPRLTYNLPTSINITAPSPMGSVRDVTARSSGDSSSTTTHLYTSTVVGAHHQHHNSKQPAVGTPIKRHSHQDVTQLLASNYTNASTQQQLVDKTSQLSLNQQQQQQQQQQRGTIQRRSVGATEFNYNTPTRLSSTRDLTSDEQQQQQAQDDPKTRSKLIDELLKTINDDSFNEFIDFNNKLNIVGASKSSSPSGSTGQLQPSRMELMNSQRPKSAIGASAADRQHLRDNNSYGRQQAPTQQTASSGYHMSRGSICVPNTSTTSGSQQSKFDNVIRRMSTNLVQNFNKITNTNAYEQSTDYNNNNNNNTIADNHLRRERSSASTTHSQQTTPTAMTYSSGGAGGASIINSNSLYVDNSQIPARRHSDNTINVPRIQVALSSPSASGGGSRTNLNQRASVSASKLANKWKLSAKTNQREASDKLSPNLSGALSYMRRHSSGNTTGTTSSSNMLHQTNDHHHHHHQQQQQQHQSNGGLGASLLNVSPFKTKSSSNLGIDFLISNRSMKRRYSAASMLGHQTQRKAEDLIDAGMKSVQNMFS